MKIAVWGAGGPVGSHTALKLAAAGHHVRLVGRRAEPLEQLAEAVPDHEVVAADLSTADGVNAAATGMDAVVYAIGLPYTKTDFSRYPGLMQLAIDGLRRHGVKRLLHISNVYPYGQPTTNPVTEDHPLQPCSVKGRFRKEQEDLVRGAHGDGLETIALRPADFYGPGALSIITAVFEAARLGKRADVLGPIDTPHEFQFVPDLAATIAALLPRDGVWGAAYNVPTAGTISSRAFAEQVFAAAGHPPKLRVAGPFMQRILGLFMPIMRELREMGYLLQTPVLLDGSKLEAVLGDDLPVTSYDAGIRATLESMARAAG